MRYHKCQCGICLSIISLNNLRQHLKVCHRVLLESETPMRGVASKSEDKSVNEDGNTAIEPTTDLLEDGTVCSHSIIFIHTGAKV